MKAGASLQRLCSSVFFQSWSFGSEKYVVRVILSISYVRTFLTEIFYLFCICLLRKYCFNRLYKFHIRHVVNYVGLSELLCRGFGLLHFETIKYFSIFQSTCPSFSIVTMGKNLLKHLIKGQKDILKTVCYSASIYARV